MPEPPGDLLGAFREAPAAQRDYNPKETPAMSASRVVRVALVLAALVGTAPAQLLADADHDVMRTLARGMVHRESQVGPLTGCLMLVKTLGEGHRVLERAFPPEFRLPEVDPGVVALAFREADDLRWELHAQVITPGYNEWIRTLSARDLEAGRCVGPLLGYRVGWREAVRDDPGTTDAVAQ